MRRPVGESKQCLHKHLVRAHLSITEQDWWSASSDPNSDPLEEDEADHDEAESKLFGNESKEYVFQHHRYLADDR
jgi:hypothetical protein